jgi:hypothetical protein
MSGDVRCTVKNERRQPSLSGPKSAKFGSPGVQLGCFTLTNRRRQLGSAMSENCRKTACIAVN